VRQLVIEVLNYTLCSYLQLIRTF